MTHMEEVILNINNVCKSFFGVPALTNVSFNLKKQHLLGLIGENGAGKSTLMNVIGGVLKADGGNMIYMGKEYCPENPKDATDTGIAFIHQELNLFTNLSIAENIFIDNFPKGKKIPWISRKEMMETTVKLLDSIDLKISPGTLVEKLSPGERQLVEIAKAMSTKAQVIIFDEPTTSLTSKETERLFHLIEKLKSSGKSIIYISHILKDVEKLSDEIVILRDGNVTGVGIKGEMNIDNMISLMVGRDIKQLYPNHKSHASKEKTLEVIGLSQSGIVHDINFFLNKGEILGIFGLMGSGRSELLKIIFGIDPYEKGEIYVNGSLIGKTSPQKSIKNKISFVTENRREEGLLMNVSIAQNIELVSLPKYSNSFIRVLNRKEIRGAVSKIAEKLRIKCASVEKSLVKSLSGGNQQKVVLSKWLMSKPSILIVDEPTRGIDVGAKSEIYEIIDSLASEGTSILFISSEIEELIGNCDRIIVMSKGEIMGSFIHEEFHREKIMRVAFRQDVKEA